MKHIYLDNSATTPLCCFAKSEIIRAMELFGNPSSLHSLGLEAEKLIRGAKSTILSSLNANPNQYKLFFCGSGTEANNLATIGVAHSYDFLSKYKKPRIITDNSQHPSIMEPLKKLESEGFEVVKIGTKGGEIDKDEFLRAITPETFLITLMLVNNETGAIYDVPSLFSAAKKINPQIITHCDAIQGYMHVDFSPASLNSDLVSISAHKINGPKGVGALCVSNSVLKAKKLSPVIFGGGQEDGIRSGTENVIGIAGFAAAAEYHAKTFKEDIIKMADIRKYIIDNLPESVRANIPSKAAPHIISLTLPKIKSETMMHFLSAKGIFISAGSACSSHSKKGNYVLEAFGLSQAEAACTVRVSLSSDTTKEMADAFLNALNEGVLSLARVR